MSANRSLLGEKRIGDLAMKRIDQLTDAKLVESAEAMEKAANAALAKARCG